MVGRFCFFLLTWKMFKFAEFHLHVHVFLFAHVNSENVLASQFRYNFVSLFRNIILCVLSLWIPPKEESLQTTVLRKFGSFILKCSIRKNIWKPFTSTGASQLEFHCMCHEQAQLKRDGWDVYKGLLVLLMNIVFLIYLLRSCVRRLLTSDTMGIMVIWLLVLNLLIILSNGNTNSKNWE